MQENARPLRQDRKGPQAEWKGSHGCKRSRRVKPMRGLMFASKVIKRRTWACHRATDRRDTVSQNKGDRSCRRPGSSTGRRHCWGTRQTACTPGLQLSPVQGFNSKEKIRKCYKLLNRKKRLLTGGNAGSTEASLWFPRPKIKEGLLRRTQPQSNVKDVERDI